jgi:hypothetical protein
MSWMLLYEHCKDETWKISFASVIDSKLERKIVNTCVPVVFTVKEIAKA